MKTLLAMMVKNEENNIIPTLDSVRGKVDYIVIYDTGSTDNTLNVIKKWIDENDMADKFTKMVTNVKNTNPDEFDTLPSFVFSFAFHRNLLLDFVYNSFNNFEQILMLDAGDMLQGVIPVISGDKLALGCIKTIKRGDNQQLSHVTIRLFRNDNKFKYKYPVHEVLTYDDNEIFNSSLSSEFSIFQNRDEEEERKTDNRLESDIVQLCRFNNPHCLFHLGQTYTRLGKYEEAKRAYEHCIITQHPSEYTFHSYLALGKNKCTSELEKIGYWNKSYLETGRIEGIFDYVEYLFNNKKFLLAYSLSIICILSQTPTYQTFHLPIDHDVYTYKRYMMHAMLCDILNKRDEGIENIKRALKELEPETHPEYIRICRQIFNNLLRKK
jgi:glycosyltransferase involved in cell wall biosynthesis